MAEKIMKQRFKGGFKYKRCPRCGETIEIDRPFNDRYPYCSECGKIVFDANAKYCCWCGAEFDN